MSVRDKPSAAVGRRRILLAVHSAKLGGAERMALLEAEYLETGFELLLAVPEGPLRSDFAAHGKLVAGVATLPLWGASIRRWTASSVRTLLDAVTMGKLIRRNEIELVLTNSSVCLAPVLAARLAGVPAVVHARDVPKSRLAPLVLALQGRLASTVIVITSGLAPYFRGGDRTRVVRIPDGIALPAAPAGRSQDGFGSPLRLCLVGGIDPRKGQDLAVAALARLRERDIDATLELVGRELDASFTATVHESAQRLGVAERVEFVGEVGDIGPHLDSADIVLAPSRDEWTPLVLMEALAHGKPVVAANVGGVPDIVRDHEFGLLVAPDSPTQLADAIVALRSDPTSAAAMAARGREHVRACFQVEHTLEKLRAEIDRLLDSQLV